MSSRGATTDQIVRARTRVEGRRPMTAAEKGYAADRKAAARTREQHGKEQMTQLMRDSHVPGVGKRSYTQAELERDITTSRATLGFLTTYRSLVDGASRSATGARAETLAGVRSAIIAPMTAYARQLDHLETLQSSGKFKAGPGYTPGQKEPVAQLRERQSRIDMMQGLVRQMQNAGLQSPALSRSRWIEASADLGHRISAASRGGGRTRSGGMSTSNRSAATQKAAITRATNRLAAVSSAYAAVRNNSDMPSTERAKWLQDIGKARISLAKAQGDTELLKQLGVKVV